jgi:hypothetical protein
MVLHWVAPHALSLNVLTELGDQGHRPCCQTSAGQSSVGRRVSCHASAANRGQLCWLMEGTRRETACGFAALGHCHPPGIRPAPGGGLSIRASDSNRSTAAPHGGRHSDP